MEIYILNYTEEVEVVDEPVDDEYEKFGWILDMKGNKIELWKPLV